MSSPERKKRKKEWSPTLQSSPVLSLPYDLLLSCVARVSRLYYPTLSLVSKSFRSLIASPELYKARSELGHTESCLYVGIQPIGDPGLTWYTLCKRPSGYVLATVSIPDYPRARFPGLVAVGSDIYNIGGSDLQSLCKGNYSRVTILDCRSHTWREAPSLRVGLCLLSASVIDGKIYVAGRCKVGVSGTKNSFEVFDTEAQFWDTLPSETQGGGVVFDSTTSIEGKFHVMTDQEAVAYDPKKGRWDLDLDGKQMGPRMIYNGYCEIDNVLYSASRGGPFAWYDTEVRMWRRLMGLVGLPKLTSESNVRLANYRGKLGVLWEGKVFSFGRWRRLKKKIWCAVIALERRNTSEIWGKLQWLDHVLTVPAETRVVKLLAATV